MTKISYIIEPSFTGISIFLFKGAIIPLASNVLSSAILGLFLYQLSEFLISLLRPSLIRRRRPRRLRGLLLLLLARVAGHVSGDAVALTETVAAASDAGGGAGVAPGPGTCSQNYMAVQWAL